MRSTIYSLIFSLGLFLTGLAPCFGQAAKLDTSHVVTFGDSLTDNDLLSFLPIPFGNPLGPVVFGADPMEAFFDKAAESGDQLTSYAVLGSLSGYGNCDDPTASCGLLTQVQRYLKQRDTGVVSPATMISIQAGGNDILDIANGFSNPGLLAYAGPGENPFADQVIREIKSNLAKAILKLRAKDNASIVVWTAPDVTLSPLVLSFGLSSTESANVRAHIDDLNQFIRKFVESGNSLEKLSQSKPLVLLDANGVLTANTFYPPVIEGTVIQPSIWGALGARTDQFADPIHPTAVVNAILANELIAEVNSVFGEQIETYSESELAVIAGINAAE